MGGWLHGKCSVDEHVCMTTTGSKILFSIFREVEGNHGQGGSLMF